MHMHMPRHSPHIQYLLFPNRQVEKTFVVNLPISNLFSVCDSLEIDRYGKQAELRSRVSIGGMYSTYYGYLEESE